MTHFTRNDTDQYLNVNQTSLFHIESNSYRLGLWKSLHGQRSQQKVNNHAPNSFFINKPKSAKVTSCKNKGSCSTSPIEVEASS